MLVPASQGAILALIVISLVCWGIWANTLKLSGKWRFEMYIYDFAVGFLLLAVGAAFTAGSMVSSELTFQENLLVASYHNIAYILAAGIVFSVGNMLLTAAMSTAGMALAFSVAYAVALTVATGRALLFGSRAGMLVALVGVVLLLATVALAAYAYSMYLSSRVDTVRQSGRRPGQKRGPVLPIALAVAGGLALGLFHPVLDLGRLGDGGVSPYGQTVLFGASLIGTTILLAPFFFTFPVAGSPLKLTDYFSGTAKQHMLGLLGGILAGIAFLTGSLALAPPANAGGLNYALSEGGPVLAAICGLGLWNEFQGSGERPRILAFVAALLLAAGIALLAISRA